ncbi:hypothetical protein EI555_017079, partial [Monodon monoceros]
SNLHIYLTKIIIITITIINVITIIITIHNSPFFLEQLSMLISSGFYTAPSKTPLESCSYSSIYKKAGIRQYLIVLENVERCCGYFLMVFKLQFVKITAIGASTEDFTTIFYYQAHSKLEITKVASSVASKLSKILDVYKSIARVLTVVNKTQKENLRKFYKGKKYKPLDLQPKKTHAAEDGQIKQKDKYMSKSNTYCQLHTIPHDKANLQDIKYNVHPFEKVLQTVGQSLLPQLFICQFLVIRCPNHFNIIFIHVHKPRLLNQNHY